MVFKILQHSEIECQCVRKITEGSLESTVHYNSICVKVQSVKNIIHPLNYKVLGFSLSSLYVNWHCLSLTLMWKCFLDIVLNCYEISKKKIVPYKGCLLENPTNILISELYKEFQNLIFYSGDTKERLWPNCTYW